MAVTDDLQADQNGVVYTKRWAVELLLDLAGYKAGFGIADKVMVEPACGSGAFISVIAERLAAEVLLRGLSWQAISCALRACDISETAVTASRREVCQVLQAADCGKKYAESLAEQWIRQEDFISASLPKADFVVGNPPYVRASALNSSMRDAYASFLPSVTRGCDLYISFYDQGLNLLRPEGVLCFICADRWMQNGYGKLLRGRISDAFCLESVISLQGSAMFESAVSAYPAITVIKNSQANKEIKFVNCAKDFGQDDVPALLQWLQDPKASELKTTHFETFRLARPQGEAVYPLGDAELIRFVTSASRNLPSLEQTDVQVGIGIATGCDQVFITEDPSVVEDDRLMPLFCIKGSRSRRAARRCWLVNPWDENGNLVDLQSYPRLKHYLEMHYDRLCQRAVVKKDHAQWYRTLDKPRIGLMDRELLLLPDMAAQLTPVLSIGLYPHHNYYWMSSNTWDMQVLGGLMMSDAVRSFIVALGVKMNGGTLRFQAQYLRKVHLPPYERISRQTRVELRRAFAKQDRSAASYFGRKAYQEAMQ